MSAQCQEWKISHMLPRFLSKMQIPSKIVGSRCSTSLGPRGKTFGALVAEIDDQDVDRRIEIMMQAKAAELDVLRNDASLTSCSIQVTEGLNETYKAFIEMDLQDDFRKDVWIIEAQKIVDASHEHLLFGKALARSHQQQAEKKRDAAIQLQRHRPRSNLSAIDRLGLHWLRENNYGIIKDDKRTALIPMTGSYLHGLKQQACSNTVQFELAVCNRLHLANSLRSSLTKVDATKTPRSTLAFLHQQVDAKWKLMEISSSWKSHKTVQVPRIIRPTSSNILTPMAQYVRMRLAPLVAKLGFVLRNSAQLVAKLEALQLPDDCVLGSGDTVDF